MKSEHRHELETNTLARILTKWIGDGKQYTQPALIAGIVLVAALFVWNWVGRSNAGRQDKTWFDYNIAVEGPEPDLELLQKSAEDHADTPAGELSELTWADGQLFRASNTYLTGKSVSKQSLDDATKAYEEIIRTAKDPLIVSRAHFGLARAYEMQPDLDKAEDEYTKVTGPFQPLAKQRLERLKDSKTLPAIEWLASAEVPRRTMPGGPGTPGVRPDFQADELATPDASAEPGASFEDILKRIGEVQPDGEGRYNQTGDQPVPGATEAPPPSDPQPPTTESPAAEPAAEPPPAEPVPGDVPSEEPPAEPPAESPQP
jgi:hypothetical protein